MATFLVNTDDARLQQLTPVAVGAFVRLLAVESRTGRDQIDNASARRCAARG